MHWDIQQLRWALNFTVILDNIAGNIDVTAQLKYKNGTTIHKFTFPNTILKAVKKIAKPFIIVFLVFDFKNISKDNGMELLRGKLTILCFSSCDEKEKQVSHVIDDNIRLFAIGEVPFNLSNKI